MGPEEFREAIGSSREGAALLEYFDASDEGKQLLSALLGDESGKGQQALVALLEGILSQPEGDPEDKEAFVEKIRGSKHGSALIAVAQKAGAPGAELAKDLVETKAGQTGLLAYIAALDS
ncbi:hypothetical protein AIOL_001342 [Candidatus Rhodobacter oscarellae]|uniref:Uncharacterized protein n=2 Tax=Candidatus Rhodobacter oscarellae TaxID=1675527 RepID=A0A0J9E0Y7_9RHOB|nr:hypothetical protein AIOL_001342 [Candidatus Rhodobacter lobularis]